ncbi:hypothetical protein ACNSPB_25935 [Yersinia enterocolitica]
MLINGMQAKCSVQLNHPQHGIDAGIQHEGSAAMGYSGPTFAIPRGVVLLIGVICFAMFLAAAPTHPEFVGRAHNALNVG